MRLMASVLLISTLALIAGACTTTGGDFCDVERVWRPQPGVNYSAGDKRAMVAHNEFGERACGWRP